MPIDRVNILDFKAFGQQVVRWATDPKEPRPATAQALRQALGQLLDIPPRITKVVYVDVPIDTLVLRIPTKEMVEESVERFKNLQGPYPAPAYYREIGTPNQPPNIDMLFKRIADYTIAQCA